MGDVIRIKKNQIFSLADAQKLLPLIQRITANAVRQVSDMEHQSQAFSEAAPEQQQIDDDLNEAIQRWSEKVIKLGATPKGFWLVDFDNGQGYFCWRYGEEEIKYHHEYISGYSGRTRISPRLKTLT